MLIRCLKAELLKCRRSPVWIAFLILPIFPAFLGTFNYLGNLGVLQSEWYSLWSQHTLFSACFFMPAQFGVFCAWQWRLEHTGHNWNTAMTAPVPPRDLFLAKWILDVGVAALAQLCIGVLFIVSGLLAGLSLSNLPALWHWLLFGAIGGVTVCTVQLFLSLVIRSFAASLSASPTRCWRWGCAPTTRRWSCRWAASCSAARRLFFCFLGWRLPGCRSGMSPRLKDFLSLVGRCGSDKCEGVYAPSALPQCGSTAPEASH